MTLLVELVTIKLLVPLEELICMQVGSMLGMGLHESVMIVH